MPSPPRPLIPRAKLFGNPSRALCQISPDGAYLSWIAPKDGVLNAWIAPREDLGAARCITADTKRGIRMYAWAADGRHLLYIQDEAGAEDWHVYVTDIAGGAARDLTPFPSIHAQVAGLSLDHPGAVVLAINNRDAAWHDLWRVDLASGARTLVYENTTELSAFELDRQLVPRLASRARAQEGGRIVYRMDGTTLTEMVVVEHEDDLTTHAAGFTRDGATLYWLTSQGRDKAALAAMDWATGRSSILAEHAKVDIGGLVSHPETHAVQAATANYLRLEYIVLDQGFAQHLAHLKSQLTGDVTLNDRSRDDRWWVVVESAAERPVTYHLYDTTTRTLRPLFPSRPELAGERLAPMRGVEIVSRDGRTLPTFVTLPADCGDVATPAQPLPAVLLVHGGPWARDGYGFNPEHQWLADRGMAVLSVNFRGSTGFGKGFLNAGDREWGRRMHDDLIDAVRWAEAEGIAAPGKVAIMGGSYGGYATLAGLAFTPEVFCCGVDVVGPSNLETLLATVPPYWAAFFENLARRVGDPRTEEGRALLRERSPVHAAHRIARPLLIGQGANDPRVKQAESDQIVAAMKAKGLPVTYVLFPEEGHGFAVPENRMAFQAIAEAFLARHLDTPAEPIGQDFDGANFKMLEDADRAHA
jgi:dipeptidyl aminopeptidase/acylaminoacyl peptidase